MRKILAGFIVAIAIGVPAIYVGLPMWAEHRALGQVDAAFEALQGSVGKASHGAVSYNVWTRTLKIDDIAVESDDPSATTLKAAQVVATGAASPAPGRIAANRIEITNGELAGLQLGQGGPRTTYRTPKISIENFSGPTALTRRPTAIAGAETMLALLEAAAATTATTVSIPTLSATVTLPQMPGSTVNAPAEYGITALTLRNLGDGRIGAATIDRIVIAGGLPDLGSYTAELENFEAADVDTGVMIPILDPAQRKDDGYRSIYRKVATGPYRISFNKAATIRFDALQLEDFAIRPSKFSDPEILALTNTLRGRGSAMLSATESQALFEKLATIYEGIRVAKFEARGIDAAMGATVAAKIGVIRLAGMADGRLAEFAVEAVDARMPSNEPVKIGRAALKGIDLVKIMRNSAQLGSNPASSSLQALGMLAMFDGIELKDVAVQKNSKQPVRIDTLALSWGQFVGLIPSQIHAASKFAFAIDPDSADRTLKYLADAGVKQMTANVEIGAAWNENTKSLVISPAIAEFADVYGVSAKLTVNNAPRALFSADPIALAQTAAKLEAGAVEFSLRDLGGFELIVAQLARDQRMTPETARKNMVDAARAFAAANPEFQTLGTAVARSLETPGLTLKVVLTPKKQLYLGDAVEIGRAAPMALLSQFDIEASTDK
jgi:hypothetical protein